MKEVLIICLIVLVLYLYKSYNDIEDKISLIEKSNKELKLEIKRLTKEYNDITIRQVNWYKQIFTNETNTILQEEK